MAYTVPPSLADLERLAADAFATIPPGLAQHVEGVAIHVVDFPDDETLFAVLAAGRPSTF